SAASTSRKYSSAGPWVSVWRLSPANWSPPMARKPKPLPTLEWLQPRLRVTRVLSLVSFLGLMVLLIIATAMAYDGKPMWVLIGIQLLPLLIMLPGILLGNARGHAW